MKTGYIISALVAAISGLAIWNETSGLRVEVEGLYLDKNWRDVGTSVNQCLANEGLPTPFAPQKLLRSNKWFSGWSCEDVGSPQAIITLNYQPKRDWQYFCRGDTVIVGETGPQTREINNIEFLSTWENPDMRAMICHQLKSIIDHVSQGRRTLFHCEAGRDRAGAVATILSAVVLESQSGELTDRQLSAIECDYRHSASLNPNKYGRMKQFILSATSKYGGISSFLAEQCSLTTAELLHFSRTMTSN